jgi:ATP-dependent Clp protease ATP-binding subunit ClpA
LAEQGYDVKYGARPLNAVFNRVVVRPLSHKLLAGELNPGVIRIGYKDGQETI